MRVEKVESCSAFTAGCLREGIRGIADGEVGSYVEFSQREGEEQRNVTDMRPPNYGQPDAVREIHPDHPL